MEKGSWFLVNDCGILVRRLVIDYDLLQETIAGITQSQRACRLFVGIDFNGKRCAEHFAVQGSEPS